MQVTLRPARCLLDSYGYNCGGGSGNNGSLIKQRGTRFSIVKRLCNETRYSLNIIVYSLTSHRSLRAVNRNSVTTIVKLISLETLLRLYI